MKINRHHALMLLNSVVAVVLAAVFISFSLRASIIADDFAYFNRYNEYGSAWGYLDYHYTTQNGRIGQALFFAVFYAIFGVESIKAVPIFLYFAIGTVLALFFMKHLHFEKFQKTNSFAAAFIVVPASLIATRSMYDTFLWMTSSTVYLGGVLFVLLALYLTTLAVSSPRNVWVWAVVLLAVTFWGGTFTEPLTMCAGVLGAALAVLSLIRRNKRAAILWAVSWAGFVLAFAAIYFSPGTSIRRKALGTSQITADYLAEIVRTLPQQLVDIYQATPWWVIVLLAASAAATYSALSSQWRQNLSLTSLLMTVVAAYLLFVVFHLAVSQLGSPTIALRTYTAPVFFSVLVFIAAFFCLGKAADRWFSQIQIGSIVFYTLAAIMVLFPLSHYTSVVNSGLELRAEKLAERAENIQQQIDSSAEKITFTPLPVVFTGEAVDLNLADRGQIPWVIKEIPEWYGVTDPNKIVVGDLPSGYCMPENTAEGIVKDWLVCQ